MKIQKIILIAAVLLLADGVSVQTFSQGLSQGRSVGLANAFTSIARGVYAPSWNPANLALEDNPSLDFNLAGLGLHLGNSTFSKHFYDMYNGKYLGASDKEDILSRIPDSGFRVLSKEHLQILGFSFKSFALTFTGRGASHVTLDKDYMKLALEGIDMNRRYDLSDTHGEGLSYSSLTVSGAHRFAVPYVDFLAVGANLRYLVGIGYASLENQKMEIYNSYDGYAAGKLTGKYALLGHGFAFDLGAATRWKGWNAGLAFSNILGSIKWTGEKHAYYSGFHTLTALNVFSLSQVDQDSAVHVDTTDTDLQPFSTRLPLEMRVGVSRTWHSFLFAADYHQGFSNRAGVSPQPYLAVAGEWQGLGFLPLRFGLGLGGYYGISPAMGFGLHAGFFKFDIGWMFRGGLLPAYAKGIDFGLNLNLRF
ncbi:MAG: hypothetical protein GXO76_04080 [Calditrichaeota bacterium]|nr:hypothetical protein [Calditrichota bacterium]